jgi:exopolysaccharide production protein ExoQ
VSAAPWESAFVVVVAVMFATKATELLLGFGGGGATNPPQVRLSFLVVYAISAILLVTRHAAWALPLRAPALAAVLAFPLISILWSVDRGETLERAVAVLGSSLFGAYLGWRFTLGRIIFLLAVAMTIAVGLSLVAIFVVPTIGITGSGRWAGTWSGVHFHKNGLGGAAALACLLIGYAITDARGRWRVAFIGTFLCALVLLVGSRSTTSLLAVLAVGALAAWMRYLQLRPTQVPVLTVLVISAVGVAAILAGTDLVERVLAGLGKRPDLSRFPLWRIVWPFIEQRFWLGYGHEAFWQPDSPRVRLIEARLYYTPFYSHNGLLETWLNGGLVLVGLVVALLVTIAAKSLAIMVRWRTLVMSSFPLAFCVFFLLVNFTESSVLARNELVWALLVALAAFLARWVRMRVV